MSNSDAIGTGTFISSVFGSRGHRVAAGLLAAIVAVVGVIGAPALAQEAVGGGGGDDAGNYTRVRDVDEGKRIVLEIATKGFQGKEWDGKPGPVVYLVGAVHIGDKAYYDAIQAFLDAQDLVLYEGVKPAAKDDLGDADAGYRVKVTKSRQRFLARVLTREQQRKNALPESIDALVASTKGVTSRLVAASRNDAWGKPIVLVVKEGGKDGGFDLVSLGADGKEGGEGPDADMLFSTQKPLTPDEIESVGQGIQIKLASALGLEFQGLAVNYDREKWRNSDMSIDEVQRRARENGASADALLSMVEGKSFSARLVGLMLGFLKNAPQTQLLVKVMMAETLAHADDAMAAAGGVEGEGGRGSRLEKQMAEMSKLMKVIVEDRNRVVLDDLKQVLAKEPKTRTIAIFYGAGHLQSMERSLIEEFGMKVVEGPEGVRWFPAMDIDVTKMEGGVQQAQQMRAMMKGMMEGARKKAP